MDHQLFTQLISSIKLHSGISRVQLMAQLKLSEKTLNSYVSYLQTLGLQLIQTKNAEFFLVQNIQPLCVTEIRRALSAREIDILPPFLTVESTNQHLKNTKSAFTGLSRLCVTEHQSHGRGRRSRQWVSSIGSDIMLSLHVRLNIPVNEVGGVSIVAGISIIEALADLSIRGLLIKWPNDIFWKNKKLAGILIESTNLVDNCVELVVGIGLNMSVSATSAKLIDQAWVDTKQLTSKHLSRNVLIARIVNRLLDNFSAYENSGLDAFQRQWHDLDYLFKKNIVINSAQGSQCSGVAMGVNKRGELLVQTGDRLINVVGGEVSVRTAR
ncbi:MAG TPA: biotin--[acetyl-CoA-carboxylase] ligase [Gammaproteobacteria bacterium]|nr:biotin--[acetyl-CoA-carboxylase] ligase [Gammaproteobacteria bacterium]